MERMMVKKTYVKPTLARRDLLSGVVALGSPMAM
jgi:hypothetical protein